MSVVKLRSLLNHKWSGHVHNELVRHYSWQLSLGMLKIYRFLCEMCCVKCVFLTPLISTDSCGPPHRRTTRSRGFLWGGSQVTPEPEYPWGPVGPRPGAPTRDNQWAPAQGPQPETTSGEPPQETSFKNVFRKLNLFRKLFTWNCWKYRSIHMSMKKITLCHTSEITIL